jgi:hypothetical protein
MVITPASADTVAAADNVTGPAHVLLPAPFTNAPENAFPYPPPASVSGSADTVMPPSITNEPPATTVDPADESPNAPPFRITVKPPLFVDVVPAKPLAAFRYNPRSNPFVSVPVVSIGPATLSPPKLVKVRFPVDVTPAGELRYIIPEAAVNVTAPVKFTGPAQVFTPDAFRTADDAAKVRPETVTFPCNSTALFPVPVVTALLPVPNAIGC